jgi:hypothetical protein
MSADLQILRLHDEISRSVFPEKAIKAAFRQAVLWKANIEILAARFADYLGDYMELRSVGFGPEKFITLTEAIGRSRMAETAAEDAFERQVYVRVFDYMKRIIGERVNKRKATHGGNENE